MTHAAILSHLAAFVAGSLFVFLLWAAVCLVSVWRDDDGYDEPEYDPY